MSKNRFKVRCEECGEEHWEEPIEPIDRSKATPMELYIYDIFMEANYKMAMQTPLVTVKALKKILDNA